MSNRIQALYDIGQSIWCDNISRHMIDGGELKRLLDIGVVGVTSNPSIFMKAITGSTDYDELLDRLIGEGLDKMGLYEGLVIPDICDAADILKPIFDSTDGVDGFVSLEVNPKLAYDTEGTIAEAKRLFATLNRRNVMIKVPATQEGMPAIEALIGAGINVNVTLIFGLTAHEQVMQAYINGLKQLDAAGGDVTKVTSVASFFVSRLDVVIDKALEEKKAGGADVDHLFGRAAIANAKLAYARFQEVFSTTGTFGALAAKGARVQRPLWASTSTKNPAYSDTMYLDGLVGPQSVNTLPPATIDATLDHGQTQVAITNDVDEARSIMKELAALHLDMNQATEKLRDNGVGLFAQSFDELLNNLQSKKAQLRAAG